MASWGGDYVLVAAIDFGTTYSAYALSFKDSQEDIRINKNWGDGLGFQSYKTATSVLTDRSGRFIDFGFDAEQKYSDALSEEGDSPRNLLLFRHFKMMLCKSTKIKKGTALPSVCGTLFPALNIFAYALRYFKDQLLTTLKTETGRELSPKLIRWVLTVPAIWSDEAKQFMRLAAFKAGLISTEDSSQLVIALEAETASLCCRRPSIAQYPSTERFLFPAGTKYLVVDCGGGTVDITSHAIDNANRVTELTVPSGGPWGGSQVDEQFIQLLKSIFGVSFIERFRLEIPQDWLNLRMNFEKVKKSFKPNGDSKMVIPFVWSMCSLYSDVSGGKSIEEAIDAHPSSSMCARKGSLILKHDAVMQLFEPVVQQIVKLLKKLTADQQLGALDYVFLVGGFGECEVLQNAVKDLFRPTNTRVLVPASAQLAIIKGAVVFGHEPAEIATRRAKYTYGIKIWANYNHLIHDYRKRVVIGGKERVKVMKVFVEKGAPIKTGDRYSFESDGIIYELDKSFGVKLLRKNTVPTKPVQYANDPNVEEIGDIPMNAIFDTPKVGKTSPPFTIFIQFGFTEFVAEVMNKRSGVRANATVKFVTD